MPSSGEEDTPYLNRDTALLKMVSDYSGLNFNEAIELDCYTYSKVAKDAITHKYSETEEGREYLQKCWRLEQTEPNRKALRSKFKGD